jgi:hypothetical protein
MTTRTDVEWVDAVVVSITRAMTHWNRRDWSGSGHAQSMLVVGRPQLASSKVQPPMSLARGLRSHRFNGTVELRWTIGRDEHLLARWRAAGKQVTVPARALAAAYSQLSGHASDLEWDHLRSIYGDDFDDAADDDPRFDTLNGDFSALVLRYAETLVPHYQRSAGDHGTWRLVSAEGGVMVGWRATRKETLLPLGLLAWVAEDLPGLLQELAEKRI